jgi:hypothetical protein
VFHRDGQSSCSCLYPHILALHTSHPSLYVEGQRCLLTPRAAQRDMTPRRARREVGETDAQGIRHVRGSFFARQIAARGCSAVHSLRPVHATFREISPWPFAEQWGTISKIRDGHCDQNIYQNTVAQGPSSQPQRAATSIHVNLKGAHPSSACLSDPCSCTLRPLPAAPARIAGNQYVDRRRAAAAALPRRTRPRHAWVRPSRLAGEIGSGARSPPRECRRSRARRWRNSGALTIPSSWRPQLVLSPPRRLARYRGARCHPPCPLCPSIPFVSLTCFYFVPRKGVTSFYIPF